eukprot:gene743-1004_t
MGRLFGAVAQRGRRRGISAGWGWGSTFDGGSGGLVDHAAVAPQCDPVDDQALDRGVERDLALRRAFKSLAIDDLDRLATKGRCEIARRIDL